MTEASKILLRRSRALHLLARPSPVISVSLTDGVLLVDGDALTFIAVNQCGEA